MLAACYTEEVDSVKYGKDQKNIEYAHKAGGDPAGSGAIARKRQRLTAAYHKGLLK